MSVAGMAGRCAGTQRRISLGERVPTLAGDGTAGDSEAVSECPSVEVAELRPANRLAHVLGPPFHLPPPARRLALRGVTGVRHSCHGVTSTPPAAVRLYDAGLEPGTVRLSGAGELNEPFVTFLARRSLTVAGLKTLLPPLRACISASSE